MEQIQIGTSGWSYKEWANDFYHGVKSREQFQFYATHFSTVEINNTFYRLPLLSTVRAWRQQAPANFVFAVKGSRFITHILRLNNLGRALGNFMRRIQPLGDKLGPILWQLPPNFKPDFPRLERFLKRLPSKYSHAIEFRHPDWMNESTFALLRKYNAAFVWVSSMRMPLNFSVTADFIYARFHGLSGGARHDYTAKELEPWAEHIRACAAEGKRAFAYFNNDLNVRAPKNAELLLGLCGAEDIRLAA
ncbi:MAG TPA: DUF72 domain-containing protein [Verrucomicrobiae bacterium]|jgi:uncharacterized protein YecE (DUF72 family)|nr:DUF72 domain-containing protein [Verrucomicrobiae bacterium]